MDIELLKRAINKYGEGNQIVVAIEEMSELQKELCKTLRGEDNYPHVVEELADVYIILNYARYYDKKYKYVYFIYVCVCKYVLISIFIC